ncbi:MAG TPA: hypothetical protein VHN14_18830 [Kofleriaceae bacterium]|jgi:hypothetical protein|nr:hypothetical protein [Kofleriaceae bacterium]
MQEGPASLWATRAPTWAWVWTSTARHNAVVRERGEPVGNTGAHVGVGVNVGEPWATLAPTWAWA